MELLSTTPSARSPAGVELFPAAPYPLTTLAGVGLPGQPLAPVPLNLSLIAALDRPTQLPVEDVAGPAGLGAFLPTSTQVVDGGLLGPVVVPLPATCNEGGLCAFPHPQDARLRVKLLPSQMAIVPRAGGGHSIGIPLELEFVGGWESHHFCDSLGFVDVPVLDANGQQKLSDLGVPLFEHKRVARGTFGADQCAAILDQISSAVPVIDEECTGVKGKVTLATVKAMLTLTPSTRPSCAPNDPRPDLAWMRNFPGTRDLAAMGCLDVTPELVSLQTVGVTSGDGPVTEGAGVRFSPTGCGATIDFGCGFVDCEEKGNVAAAQRATTLLGAQLNGLFGGPLGRSLWYDGGGGWFDSSPPPICDLAQEDCRVAASDHLVGATLTSTVYGWFGNAVVGTGPNAGSTPYLDVASALDPCPPGALEFTPPGSLTPMCASCAPPAVPVAPTHLGEPVTCFSLAGAATDPTLSPRGRRLDFGVAAPDDDHDGVLDAVDTCKGLGAKNQKDSDGDGFGDPCDACPTDPAEWNAKTQFDQDGVCQAVDNCPSVANPSQANVNLEVETVRQAERLGDACEPVPAPDFTFRTTASEKFGCRSLQGVEICSVRDTLDDVTLAPRGPRSRWSGEMTPSKVDATKVRYCFPGDDVQSTQDRCADPAFIDDSFALLSVVDEVKATSWRRVTTRQLVTDAFPLPPFWVVRDRSVSMLKAHTYADNPAETFTWLWQTDLPIWQALIGEQPRPGGRFWMHADTVIGMKGGEGSPLAEKNGLHEYAPGAPQTGPAEGLANVYQPLTPNGTRPVLDRVNYDAPFAVERLCLACSVPDPRTWKREPWLERLTRLPGGLPMTFGGDSAAYLTPEGAVVSPELPVSPAVLALLATPGVRRVSSVDPNPLAGKGPSQPQSWVVAEDATLLGGLTFGAGGLVAWRGVQVVDEDSFHPIQAGAAAPRAGSAATLPATTGAQLLYSSSQAVMFSLGGARDGRETGEVWRAEVDDGVASWRKLAVPEGRLRHVVAATYQPSRVDAATGRLWVLDEAGAGWGKRARLWRVDAESGEAVAVGDWPRLGLFDRHWLTLDSDGSVLLTASSEALRVHVMFRLDVDARGRLVTTVVRVEKGWLTAAPSVDMNGYALLVQSKRGALPRPVHTRTLRVERPRYTHVGACL